LGFHDRSKDKVKSDEAKQRRTARKTGPVSESINILTDDYEIVILDNVIVPGIPDNNHTPQTESEAT